ncbi:MAG: class I SAM-dependent DNA methyltransferase [Promethearchaeota archaeon]
MYKELAKYYDIIYSWKEYKKEINRINKLIKKYKLSEGNKLLDVGCGTGKHLQYFKDNYLCTGIDLNNEMINIAKTNISNVTFTQANMIDFDLNDT